ncbi:MAG TPA: CHRD domain-containing protein [Anaerolineae bacterium]
MKKLGIVVLTIIALLAVSSTAFADLEVSAEADLDGSQEVPSVMTDMTGEVDIKIKEGNLEFELEVEDNTHEIFAAHIHCAPPGENGPVGVTLFTGSFTDEDGTLAEGTVTAPDEGNECGWEDLDDVAIAIINRAAYANVHTTAESGGVPSGEIRGNLRQGDAELELETEADLSGSQEVPPVMTTMTGHVEIEIDNGELEFELEVEDNTHEIFAAHIHCAPPGENGPVGVTLFTGSFTDEGGTLAEGTVTAPDAGNECNWEDLDDVAIAIINRAAYANVHTTAESGGVPSGEIRGNLPGVDLEVEVETEVDLSGSQEVPPVTTDMTGHVEIEIDNGKLEFELEVEDNTHEIFAAHIHCGVPGENGPVGVTLFMGSFTDEDGTLAEGIITAPDEGNECDWEDLDDVTTAIIGGAAYANVHTTAESGGVPSGEIRGNLP